MYNKYEHPDITEAHRTGFPRSWCPRRERLFNDDEFDNFGLDDEDDDEEECEDVLTQS